MIAFQSSLSAVLEEDEIDDFPASGLEAQEELPNAEDDFDIRDLLLDDTD